MALLARGGPLRARRRACDEPPCAAPLRSDVLVPGAVGLFLVLACAAIFQTDLHIYDTARFMELALLVGVLPCLVLSRRMSSVAIHAVGACTRALLLTMVAIAGLSVIMAAHVSAAFEDLALNLGLVLLSMTIYAAVTQQGKGGAADTLLFCMFPLVIFSILLRFAYELITARLLGETFQWTSPFLSFANVRFFSQLQAYSVWLVCLPLALPDFARRLRWFFFLAAAGFWMLLVLVPSRSVCLALVLSATLALIIFSREAVMKWLRPAMMSLLVGIASACLLMASLAADAPGPQEAVLQSTRVTDRLELWGASVSLIAANPVLGIGPANFAFFHQASIFGHPHNALLQFAVEYGLPVAGLLLLLVARFLVQGARAVGVDSDGTIDSALFAAITCGLIDAMFSGNNLMPHSQVVMATLLAWFLGRTADRAPECGERRSRDASGLALRAAACAVWGALLWAAWSYGQFAASQDYLLTTAGPRFWFDSRSVYYAP